MEYDVKGSGLTSGGFRGYRSALEGSDQRREMHIQKQHGELFGPFELVEALADFDRITHDLRHRGFPAPIPAVVLKLPKLIYEGELVDAREVVRQFGLPRRTEFAVYVRVYPNSTSTRVSDFMRMVHLPVILTREDNLFASKSDQIIRLPAISYPEYKRRVAEGREIWREIELPRLARIWQLPEEQIAGEYFGGLVRQAYRNLWIMARHGITPHSGTEPGADGNWTHLHLQNKTTKNLLEIEWGDRTIVNELRPDLRIVHWERVLSGYYELVVCMGLIVNQQEELPSFANFLQGLLQSEFRPRSVSREFLFACEGYIPNSTSQQSKLGVRRHPVEAFLSDVKKTDKYGRLG